MSGNKVLLFRQYPFEVGQRIRIEGGRRAGDWEVIGVDEKMVRLRCPVKGTKVEWARFCYSVSEHDPVER